MKKIISNFIHSKNLLNISFSFIFLLGFCQLFASDTQFDKSSLISKQEFCKVSQNHLLLHSKFEFVEQSNEFEDDDNENDDNSFLSKEALDFSSLYLFKCISCNSKERWIESTNQAKKIPLFILYSNLKIDLQN